MRHWPLLFILVSISIIPETTQAAVSAPHVKYFGYWDAACQNPFPAQQVVYDQRSHANVIMNTCLFWDATTQQLQDRYQQISLPEAAGLKIVFNTLYIDIQSNALRDVSENAVVFQAWANYIRAHRQNAAAIFVADEYDCGAPFPNGWTPENCTAARLRLESLIAPIKAALPGIPTWVNYTSAYINGVNLPNSAALGYQVPTNADWISMDCYTPWENCYGSMSVETLTNGLISKLSPNQNVVFIPQSFYDPTWAVPFTESQVAAVAEQYYNYAQTHSRVVGIFPFIWWNVPPTGIGTRDSPTIRAKYTDIGRRITGNRGTPGDYTNDYKADPMVWRPSDGGWYVPGASQLWGASADIPVPGDFNGDGMADKTVWRPSDGTWYIFGQAQIPWGQAGDVPVPGDYDGDGKTDAAVFRLSNVTWSIRNSRDGSATNVPYGLPTDLPVPADYSGDGKSDIAVFRPSDGTWYINGLASVQWGSAGDIPVPGDYDGDGFADLMVFRPSDATWYLFNRITGASQAVAFGQAGDIPVAADYDGDRKMDIAVFRPSDGRWYIDKNSTLGPWGTFGDIPAVNSVVTVLQAMGLHRHAQYVSQTVPSALQMGAPATAQVTMINSGLATWRDPLQCGGSDCGYRIGSQNPQDNQTWGRNRLTVGAPVYPGQTKPFSIAITAPTTAGTYNFQWRMGQENVTWFGDLTPNVAIQVTSQTPPPPTSGPPSAPDLSGIDGRSYSLFDTILLNYSGTATGFNWDFLPIQSNTTRVLAPSWPAPVLTTVPSFQLSRLSLSPGLYDVRVQAVNGSQVSAWSSARITLNASELDDVRVFPNPFNVRRQGNGVITFAGLKANTTIKIFTVSGRWVRTLNTSATSIAWDLTNDNGEPVASGIYPYVMTTGSAKKTGRITVVR